MVEAAPLFVEGGWDIPYSYTAGRAMSRFLEGLREGQLIGQRCQACNVTYVPPRPACSQCNSDLDAWQPLGNEGEVAAVTVIERQYPGSPPPPFTLALVRLDGADTPIVQEVRGGPIRRGDRVRVEWADDRQGLITDFHFVRGAQA